MATPYPGLTAAQVTLGQALVAHRRWRGRAGLCALRADGSLLELRSAEMTWPAGGVPYLTDSATLGHLLDLLCAATEGVADVEMGKRAGRAYCTLSAPGGRERTWEGDVVAEVVGQALLARWEAMDRKR